MEGDGARPGNFERMLLMFVAVPVGGKYVEARVSTAIHSTGVSV